MRPDSILIIGLRQQVQDVENSTPGQRVAESQNLKVIIICISYSKIF